MFVYEKIIPIMQQDARLPSPKWRRKYGYVEIGEITELRSFFSGVFLTFLLWIGLYCSKQVSKLFAQETERLVLKIVIKILHS